MSKPPVQKAFAIIIRYDAGGECKLLVLELKSVGYEFYRLPGGNVEANETPLQAAYRETREESGIDNPQESLQFIRKIGTTRYFKPFIQSNVERTDYLFKADIRLPDQWERIGTVGAEAGAVFAFSWISHSSIEKIDPELRTFLTRDSIPELFSQRPLLGLKREDLFLSPYRDEWEILFELEKKNIEEAIGGYVEDIQHVGSTSIPGMSAKPILDIAIAVKNFEEARVCIEPLSKIGYIFKGEYGIPGRHYFTKGEPRTHHIHMVERVNEEWTKMILFRDHLRSNPGAAENYKRLKLNLSEEVQGDRTSYQTAKGDFIQAVIQKAKKASI